jgi:RES domain-containing protein
MSGLEPLTSSPATSLLAYMLVRPNASASPGRSLDLKAPSVTVRGQHNYLIDPAHPDFAGVEVSEPEPLDLAPRITGV